MAKNNKERKISLYHHRKVDSIALTWSTEDLSEQAYRLFKSDLVDKDKYLAFKNLSVDDRHALMKEFIDEAQDYIIEKINQILSDGLYDHFKST